MSQSQFAFEAIGTKWQIDIFEEISKEVEVELLEKIKARIEIFDKYYSRFRKDSLVTEMSLRAGEYTLPDDGEKMLSLYEDLYKKTDGKVTPLIGQVLSQAGYDAGYSLKAGALRAPALWQDILTFNFPKLLLRAPVLLDFGALGKGYLIDIVSEIIENNNIKSFCVDAGGDMFYRNALGEALRVGLEHPDDPAQVIGVAILKEGSICGSAGNRRAWGDFHHIIDPHTLLSPRHIKAIWTTAKSTIIADAMTTCLFFVSAKTLSDYEFEYLIMYADNSIEKSTGFEAELFLRSYP